MTRPRRLYKSDKGYYYIEKGKKVFVKVPKGVTDKQISKVNIRDIYINQAPKRIKRKTRKTKLTYEKKVYTGMNRLDLGGISYYIPGRQIKEIPDQIASNVKAKKEIEETKDATVKKLTNIISTQSKQKIPDIETEFGGISLKRNTISELVGETSKVFTKAQKGIPIAPKDMVIKFARNYYSEKKQLPTRADINEYIMLESDGQYSDIQAKEYNDIIEGLEKSLGPDLGKDETELPEPTVKSRFTKFFFTRKSKSKSKSKGAGDVEDGLYSDEVETIARKRLKYYVPVIANDETDELMKYVKRGDKEFAFIVNTDDSDEGGRHWRCVYIDNRDDYPSVEWYDPLTEMPMPKHIATACKKIAMKMNPEVLFKFKSNAIRQQSKMSSRCGIHCVRFLEDRHEGISFPDATGYTQFIEEMKKGSGDLDGSDNGEKEVSKKIPTYSSYI